jgi:hypothetical protein
MIYQVFAQVVGYVVLFGSAVLAVVLLLDGSRRRVRL